MTYWKPTRPILMTADPVGGVWTYALELCGELGRADIKIVLATMGRKLSRSEKEAVARLSNVELFESDYKLEWMENSSADVEKAGRWLLDLQSRTSPSLIHLNQYSHGALRWNVPCLMVGHSCVFSWFEAVKKTPPPDRWNAYKQAVTIGLRGADLVTAPTRFMLSALEKHYGSFAAADPIYNGRSASLFNSANKQDYVFTAGRLWDEAKNVSALQQIAARIPWPIYAAGPAESPDGNAVDLSDIHALGALDIAAIADWFSRAAIFVLPARYEPFGFTALEAALSGCALVLGDIPSVREIWGDAAFFVPPDDSDALLTALLQLIDDLPARQDFARRGQERARSFTHERMAAGYLALYGQLLSSQSQRIADNVAPGKEI